MGRFKLPAALALTIGIAAAPPALGCSCTPLPSSSLDTEVRGAYDKATTVVLARVVSIESTETASDDGVVSPGERIRFQVLRSWKGAKQAGDEVSVESEHLGAGGCDRSVRNDPVWLEAATTGDAPTRAPPVSDTWLLYGGTEPWGLSLCSRSMPIDVGETQREMEILDRLAAPD